MLFRGGCRFSEMKQTSIVAILIFYLVAMSLPGLLGLSTKSFGFVLYQAICLLIFWAFLIFHTLLNRSNPLVFFPSSRKFFFTYLAISLVSIIWILILSIINGESIFQLAQFILPVVLVVTMFAAFSGSALEEQGVVTVLKAIVWLALFSGIYNILLNADAISSISSITNSYQTDFRAFYYNRNVFGFMMAIGFASSFYLWIRTKKNLHLIIMAFLGLNVFLSMSRGALAFLGIFLVVFLVLRAKRKLLTLISTALILIILSIPLLRIEFIQKNILRVDNADTGRGQLREFGWEYFIDHNILMGNGQDALNAIMDELALDSFHNLYIELLATQGIMGLLAFLVAIFFAWGCILKVKKSDQLMGTYFQATFLAYLVYIFIESLPVFYATPNSLVLTYIVIILPMLLSHYIEANGHGDRNNHKLSVSHEMTSGVRD